MASSGIGGQAVMEGIMMKNKDNYAIAIRKPDKTVIIEAKEYKSICKNKIVKKVPVVRGIINFVDSLILGMKTLTFSASFFEEEEKKKSELREKLEMSATLLFSFVLAIGIFMVIPFYLSLIFQSFITSQTVILIIEGFLRLLLFVIYVLAISKMEDIKRVFMYHGAEHKCINCIENGLDLTIENVKLSSRLHKRCGTSFLFLVIIVSIIATMFIRVDTGVLRLLIRLLLIPFIAGISYELIQLAGKSENPVINFFAKPGLWMQTLTTKEPEDEMIEIGIASVEAVFDWRSYLEKK